jgi:hypothetical protein
MVPLNSMCPAPHCTLEIPIALEAEGVCLKHYVEKASQKLATVTLDFQCGREIDSQAMQWLLAQVNFAVETLAQEDATWDDEERSLLLELVLGVANLNESLRHSKMVVGRFR